MAFYPSGAPNPFQSLWDLIAHLGTGPARLAAALLPVTCMITEAIINPEGVCNFYVCLLIDLVVSAFPSTPEQYTVWKLFSNFSAAYPGIGWGPVYEIFEGIAGILALYLVVKAYRLVPFVK